MRRVFKSRTFRRWAHKSGLTDGVLLEAVAEMERGLIDADLGGGLFKKRVPQPGHGKRGSARTLIATNRNDRWIFLGGFLKAEQENLKSTELTAFKNLASTYLSMSEEALQTGLYDDELEEIIP